MLHVNLRQVYRQRVAHATLWFEEKVREGGGEGGGGSLIQAGKVANVARCRHAPSCQHPNFCSTQFPFASLHLIPNKRYRSRLVRIFRHAKKLFWRYSVLALWLILSFIKPTKAHITYTTVRLVNSFMFMRNSAIFRQSTHQCLKLPRVQYIAIMVYITWQLFLQLNLKN